MAKPSVLFANQEPSLIAYPAVVSSIENDLTIDIESLHHSWRIQLKEKSLLGSVSSVQVALYDLPEFFNGSVVGESDSWVRLARSSSDSVLTGHIYSDGVLFELQHREDLGGQAIARMADANNPYAKSTTEEIKRLAIGNRAIAGSSLPLSKAIKVGIVVDSRYNEQHNGRGLAHALGVMNGVDGLYQDQLGLAVVVESFRVYETSDSDPLYELTDSADELLERYRNERLNDSELSSELALVHLFSGFRDDQKVIGLGWINTACSLNGYDLSLSTPFPFDILLAAHEIAHNLGAIHDDDAQCMSDEGISGAEIMWSELSGSTRPNFSSCSLVRLNQTINTGACIRNNIDMGIGLDASTASSNPELQTIQVSVLNKDATRAASQVKSLTTFPIGTTLLNVPAGCSTLGATLSCQHGTIDAKQTSVLSADALFSSISNPVITTELNLDLFMDTRHQDNRAAIQISQDSALISDAIANPEASPASGDPATTNVNQLFGESDNDQNASTSVTGGSSGIKAGSTSALMALILGLCLLLRRYWQASCQIRRSEQDLKLAFNGIACNPL
ncbi:MAG: M12 family metallo-peptidase [Granulosicoccus sp.]